MINLMYCIRERARQKANWNEVISCDLNFMGLMEDMAQDRILWRSRIKIIDHR